MNEATKKDIRNSQENDIFEKRITTKQLAKKMGFNPYTIHTWLCRSEFSKFYRRDRYFGKLCESFVYNREFKKTFRIFLKKKTEQKLNP